MRSLFQNKKLTLLLAILGLGALTVLALGMREIRFNAGQPVGRNETEAAPMPPVDPSLTFREMPVSTQILFWLALLSLGFLVSLLLSPEMRKYFLRQMFRLLVGYWLLYFVFKNYGDRLAGLMNIGAALFNLGQLGGEETNLPPPVFVPPQETPWVSYLAGILLVLFLFFAVWRSWGLLKNISLPKKEEKPLDEIARIARASLRDLSEGGDSTDVIMNCYFRMSRVVSDKRMLHRKASMTPAEFATRLERAGLPGEAVQRLTRLFEGVRYGGYRAGPKDVNEAVTCLTSILNYCGEPV